MEAFCMNYTDTSFIIILLNIVLAAVVLLASVYDIRYREFPAVLVAVTYLVSFLKVLCSGDIKNHIALGLAVTAIFFLISLISHSRLGMGDALMIGALSLSGSIYDVMMIVTVSVAMSLSAIPIAYLTYAVRNRKKEIGEISVPMIPFILIGFVLSLI